MGPGQRRYRLAYDETPTGNGPLKLEEGSWLAAKLFAEDHGNSEDLDLLFNLPGLD